MLIDIYKWDALPEILASANLHSREKVTQMPETVSLSFLKGSERYLEEKPYFLGPPLNQEVPPHLQTNLEYETLQNVRIEDVRDHGMEAFNIDDHSFRFMKHQNETDLSTVDISIKEYCAEMSKFVQDLFNAERVICYDFRVRNQKAFRSENDSLTISRHDATKPRQNTMKSTTIVRAFLPHQYELFMWVGIAPVVLTLRY